MNSFGILLSFILSFSKAINLPPQTVLLDEVALSVLGDNATFRTTGIPFNPTNTESPFFQVWDLRFLDILGPNPRVQFIAEGTSEFEFAHEAPIWDPIEEQVFFTSAESPPPFGTVDANHNSQIFVINLKDVKDIPGPQNITFTNVPINPPVQVVNGGTPFRDKLLFVGNGRFSLPPTVSLVNPRPPFNSTTILDNFHGRQFNSFDDVRVHPKSGAIFVTDTVYGFDSGFRPPPELPNQVYRLDPDTREIHVVADGFVKTNGIAFSPDGNTAYVTDTGACCPDGPGTFNDSSTATIYAYDVDSDIQSQRFLNRRTLIYADSGIPDGIQVDSNGNIFTATADGVQVYNSNGILLGKIFLGGRAVNMVFAGDGRLVIMAGTKIALVHFAANGSLVELT